MTATVRPSEIACLQTEFRNPSSAHIDTVSTLKLCQIIHENDATVSAALKPSLKNIAVAIDHITDKVGRGGRVLAFGAGTSGRLAVLDYSELVPTFSADPSTFIAKIAGGDVALRHPVEGKGISRKPMYSGSIASWLQGVEDSPEEGAADLYTLNPTALDTVIGIAASGRTPYVMGALSAARQHGCNTVGIVCVKPSKFADLCDILIETVTGAEVITGSTRMKAGTATKLVLNMISSGVMIKLGKTYGNLMVDVRTSNAKLRARARVIVRSTCPDGIFPLRTSGEQERRRLRIPIEYHEADGVIDALIAASAQNLKLAIILARLGCPVEEGRKRLENAQGVLSKVFAEQTYALSDELSGAVNHSGSNGDLYLCIDGGGTKTVAAIADNNGRVLGRGEAGSSNITIQGIPQALSQVSRAITHAVANLQAPSYSASPKSWPPFTRIWVGLAGVDRSIDVTLPMLTEMFPVPPERISLTNDAALLLALMTPLWLSEDGLQERDVVTMIAGTGSIAISHRKTGDGLGPRKVKQLRRSGGWGYLLGDSGSGYSTGRRAVQAVLSLLESGAIPERETWPGLVLRHFDSGDEPGGLLGKVYGSGREREEGLRIKKIAGCTPIIFEAAFREAEPVALAIVDATIAEISALIAPLIKRNVTDVDGILPNRSILILSGGLFKETRFGELLKADILRKGWEWVEVVVVADPAELGALALAKYE